MSRGKKAGISMADSCMEWIHLMYNKSTAKRVLVALIERLQERLSEFD